MGKIIRRTITLTITESWTIVWLPDGEPPSHPATVWHNTLIPEEEPDETLQVTLNATTDLPRTHDPTAALNAPATALDPPPADGSTRSTARRQRKRSRGQRAADNP